MKFIVKTNANLLGLGRIIGYRFLDNSNNELSFVRPIAESDYPRFHIYATKEKDAIIFNLHLDQKKPSYEGSHAHSGEYEGELVEREAERIKRGFGIRD